MSVRNPGRRAFLYGGSAIAAGAVLLAGAPAEAAATSGGLASPKDFGAAGDGVTDDTAAINQCLAASRAVDFGGPDNVYLITGTLLADRTANQVLVGSGATIKAGAAANMLRLQNAGHSVSGLLFDGNNQTTGCAIIVEVTAPGSEVDGCSFVTVAGPGVNVSADRTRVTGNSFRRCGRAMTGPFNTTVCVADAAHVTVADNELLECDWGIYFRCSTDAGIGSYTCVGNTVSCLSAGIVASQGISNQRGHNARIQDNTIVGFGDNSIDCWGCNNITITGNNITGGKDGVFVGDASSSNITITGNTFKSPQRGVRVLSATSSALIIGVVISGNTVATPTDGGILISESGTAQVTGVTVADNDLHIGGAGAYGVSVLNAECSRISGNRVYRPKGEAIKLSGTDLIEVSNNLLQDAGYTLGNTVDAISITGANRALVRNNTVYGSARYAVAISGGTGMTVSGTRWRGTSPGGVNDGATTTILADNAAI